MGNRAGIVPGVDFRGQSGYVLGPPSVHPDGHRYRWVNPRRDDLAPAPQWLFELMTPERTLNGSKDLRVSSSPAYGRAALRHELERLSQAEEGTRNHALNRAAFALRCDAFLTMEKESKLPAAAEHVERHTGLRIMRPATYWGVLARWAALYY
jgi:hypothetical protein